MDDFEEELKAGFLEEASQLLTEAERCFLVLESNPQDIPTLDQIFRVAHNLKGSAKAVGFDGLGAFTHEFESLLLRCKSGQLKITPATVSLLLKCNDHVIRFVELLKADRKGNLPSDELIGEIRGFSPAEAVAPPVAESVVPAPVLEDLLAAADSTEPEATESTPERPLPSPDLFLETAEPSPVSAPPAPPAAGLPPAAPAAQAGTAPVAGAPTADESIRVSVSRVEKLLNFVGELVILQAVLKEQSLSANTHLLRRTVHQLSKVTKEVQDISMGLRMLPMRSTFQKMQRIVRDTSSMLGKSVTLVTRGEDTEVDKTILESLSDPLVHLIRNAVDHGIETPADRLASGKSESGTVSLEAFHRSGKLVIEVRDDGGGIPAKRLRAKAIEKGILRPDQEMSDRDTIQLIFHAGFSTKSQVTEVSGRGVGMDVVKTNIEKLGGDIVVQTEEGKGSVFQIVLPLTLAIIDGMIVRCRNDRYVVPLSHVHETVRPVSGQLCAVAGLGEILKLREENLPVVRLASALRKPPQKGADPADQIALIVRSQLNPFAVMVDDILGQSQVVIKKLGAEVQTLRGYSGSAILGDGKPALILELGELAGSTPPGAGAPGSFTVRKEGVA